MAKKKEELDGVWRTIGGRRVFIRKGQDLSSAMKESGKFKTKMNEKAVKGVREEDLKDQYIESLNNVSKMEYNGEITRDEYDEAIKNINKEYKNRKMGDKFYTRKDETNRYKEKTLNDVYSYTDKQIDENKNPLFSREDKFYTRKDGTREYDPYKGTRFEKKYDSVEEALNDPNHPTRKYIDEKEKTFSQEVKEYKLKNENEYHTAKEVLLSRFKRTYNDGDTIKDKYEERMNNIRILEEDKDYVLYASNDNGFIDIQKVSSYNPNSRFKDMPNVYFEQDYKGNIKKGSAQVNWAAYGSQDPETTKEFINKLTSAQKFAEKINKGENYSKLWGDSNDMIKEEYLQYMREHPNSNMSIDAFKKMYKN